MDVFPLSWPLAGRRVALIGSGPAAARKRALLEKTPAVILDFAQAPAADALKGCAFAIVALVADDEARAAAAAAREAGVPVNVVDRTDLSDFHIPAIVDRGDLVVGVATGGAAPVLARDARERIEAALPPSFAQLGILARRIRADVKAARPDFGDRRAAWEAILRGPAGRRARAGDIEGAVAMAHAWLAAPAKPQGVVHIVGAGPGDPELLTLKALRALSDADLIVYDRLVSDEILDLARRDSERLYVGKARSEKSVPQADIHDILVAAAKAGRRVVRLKGGDPFIFGRGGEELEALRAAGVEAHVVPGISAALGCAAAAGTPLTHRDHAQAVTFLTGHAKEGGAPDLDWAALAAPNHTLAIYMGAANAAEIALRLIDAGRDPATPTLIVENGTRPDQRLIASSLAKLGADIVAVRLSGPALLIVGAVAAMADGAAAAELWRAAELAAA